MLHCQPEKRKLTEKSVKISSKPLLSTHILATVKCDREPPTLRDPFPQPKECEPVPMNETETVTSVIPSSKDIDGFTTVKRRKNRSKKQSNCTTQSCEEENTGKQSKFWKTSPLQISSSTSMQINIARISTQEATGATVTNATDSIAVLSNTEPIPVDSVSTHNIDDEIVSSANEDTIKSLIRQLEKSQPFWKIDHQPELTHLKARHYNKDLKTTHLNG
ncbi:hypothetical protein AVEN_55992-1 [Araneus ventricosus]|uniref:Uncharacterized protein n=1 Tax=Araneus ventricosus TaxID=182803 RepID=A0A4Y2JQA5_ARAVE|nr:hypothetical protein AVEN_55992-1 [Araneus ventricosus]